MADKLIDQDAELMNAMREAGRILKRVPSLRREIYNRIYKIVRLQEAATERTDMIMKLLFGDQSCKHDNKQIRAIQFPGWRGTIRDKNAKGGVTEVCTECNAEFYKEYT